MKKIFSSVLLLLVFPFKKIKELPRKSFVSGLIFGAVFSLLVNIITVQIQEAMDKQRILEAVEWEIYNNSAQASAVINEAGNIFSNKTKPNPFFHFSTYSRDLWEQSSEPLQYIAQLPPDIQAQVVVYYTVTIREHNEFIEKLDTYANTQLNECYNLDYNIRDAKQVSCEQVYYAVINIYMETASSVFDSSMDVLKVYHPTQDRLNNWFLKSMMGDKSVRVLSGK